MPLDTSIPLQIGQGIQTQALNPMSLYQMVQDRQMNALRERALQQEMAKNSLAMQYAAEDRRAAAATAAQDRARKNQLLGIFGNYGQTPAVIGQRGAAYSGTGVANDPNADIQTKLIQAGFPDQAKTMAELSDKSASERKTKAETEGFNIKNIDARLTQIKSLAPLIDTKEGAAAFSKLITQIVPEFGAIAGDPDAAAQRNAAAFEKDPFAWRTQVSNLTPEQLVQAHERATAPMKYSVQDTAQGLMRVPEAGTGPVIPLKGPSGEQLMPVDRRSVTNINNYDPADVTAQKVFMENVGKQRETYASAPATLENIEKAKELIPNAKTFLGTGGQGMLEAAKFFNNRLGTSIDTKGVSSAEELRSRLFMGVMDNLKKMDAQPTGRQQEALQEAIGQLNTDPNALPQILDILGDSLRAKVDFYNKDVTEAERRGVKFPYKPQIDLPAKRTNTAASLSVTTPDGKIHTFPTAEAAAKFKAAAGIQ